MTEEQKAAFRQVMSMTMQTYNREKPSNDVLRVWWSKLEKYEIDVVCRAFDQWIESQDRAPTPADIIELCRHKVTIHARLPSPLNIAESKEHADEVKKVAEELGSNKRDMRAWAKRILANPKNFPDISVKYAEEAMKVAA